MLLLHPVGAGSDGSQGLAAALLPLEKAIPFLQYQVDVMALGAVELDDLLVFIIPQGKFLQPFGNEGVFLHIRKSLALVFVLPALAAYQTLKAREPLRRVVQHSIVDSDRLISCLAFVLYAL